MAAKELFKIVNGSYSAVTMIADHGLLAFRDPFGLRPLVWGKRKGGELASGESHMVASEAVALEINGYEVVRPIQPGEVLFIDLEGQVHSRVIMEKEPRHLYVRMGLFCLP